MNSPRIQPKENPGQGRTGAAKVKWQCETCLFYSRNYLKFQALCRLIFLQSLIGPYFEPELSLAIDRAVIHLEAA
jgi:hypothetical protein